MMPSIANRIPLVRRAKKPALPLDQRITILSRLAVEPAGANHRDLVARTSGVLNYAALIASDVGMPDLATTLCWRQHRVFAAAGALRGDVAVMSLMPLINISRLLTREGNGNNAYDVLHRLYRAARKRSTTEICGNTVNMSKLIPTDTDHRKICEELWVTVLVDGARALARIGRWTEAAEAMSAHRGIGNRLLDGRQIKIMSLMERGLDEEARATIDSTAPRDPWEVGVAALLRLACRPASSPLPQQDLNLALEQTLTLVGPPDPTALQFQARAGLAALDLARERTSACLAPLQDAVVNVALQDGYAARDVLNHQSVHRYLSDAQTACLKRVIGSSGLGAGKLPPAHMRALTEAVDRAEVTLGKYLHSHADNRSSDVAQT